MLERARELASELAALVDTFDPAVVHADDAAALVDVFTRVERLATSGRTLAARRAAEAHAWKREGFSSADQWLADKTGETRGRAKRTLELGERLDRHEDTRREYTKGNLSETQADIVTGAAEENPDAEGSLLDAAQQETVKTLKEEAARAKAQAGDEEERQAKIHRERYGSGGPDEDGAYRLSARMSAFQGGIFDTIWRRFREQIVTDAKKRSERLSGGQIGADALVLMAQTAVEHLEEDRDALAATGTAGGSAGTNGSVLPEVRLHLLVDHAAWERGRAEAGETCELDGIGPVTAAQAKELTAHGAFVTASTVSSPTSPTGQGAAVSENVAERDTTGRTADGTAPRNTGPDSSEDGTALEVHRVVHVGTCDPAVLTAEKIWETLTTAGEDVQDIETDSRHVPAVLDTAITIRDRLCAHPSCDRRIALQRDHVLAVELDGKTTYRNLQRLCWHHHQAKTKDDMVKIRARWRAERAERSGCGERSPREARAGPAP